MPIWNCGDQKMYLYFKELTNHGKNLKQAVHYSLIAIHLGIFFSSGWSKAIAITGLPISFWRFSVLKNILFSFITLISFLIWLSNTSRRHTEDLGQNTYRYWTIRISDATLGKMTFWAYCHLGHSTTYRMML